MLYRTGAVYSPTYRLTCKLNHHQVYTVIVFPYRLPSDTGAATEEFAEYLRSQSWSYGSCDDDGVIVLSISDRQVGVL